MPLRKTKEGLPYVSAGSNLKHGAWRPPPSPVYIHQCPGQPFSLARLSLVPAVITPTGSLRGSDDTRDLSMAYLICLLLCFPLIPIWLSSLP